MPDSTRIVSDRFVRLWITGPLGVRDAAGAEARAKILPVRLYNYQATEAGQS